MNVLEDLSKDARRCRARMTSVLVVGAVPLVVACGADGGADGGRTSQVVRQRIIGGTEASGTGPVVRVRAPGQCISDPWHCGGTLIGPQWVLTAAHCVSSPADGAHEDGVSPDGEFSVVASCLSMNDPCPTVSVNGVFVHPDYVYAAIPLHDIALLELAEPVATKPARLMTSGRMAEVDVGDYAELLGWGTSDHLDPGQPPTPAQILRHVDDEITELTTCHGMPERVCFGSTTDDHVGGCSGDSGGPALVQRDGENFVFGVLSSTACGGQTVAYQVYKYFDWIVEQTESEIPPQSYLPSAQIIALTL